MTEPRPAKPPLLLEKESAFGLLDCSLNPNGGFFFKGSEVLPDNP